MDNKQCQNENDMSLHYTSRGKFDASQCEPRISSDEENTIRSAILLQKGEEEAGEIFANSPERLHDYTILKGVNSYAALGGYYLVHETSVPEEMYEYMDLDALGCRYEDEHPGVFIGSDYVCYPAEEQSLTTLTCAAYRVTENGQTRYFTTSPGEELLDAAQTLRRYCTNTEHSTGKFISLYSQAQPITPEEYQNLIRLRMENTGKVTGAFDLDFDKREFSAVHIMDGWTTWAMRDVSTAACRATQKQYASEDVMWRKLLDHLNGKELTSTGHLTAQNFSFSDEIMMEDGKLNFYIETNFDVDAAFGTFVCTDENDDWLNIYANYDIAQDRPCDTLELNLCKGDGTEENWSYHLNAAEQEVLARKMEAFCQQQNGMSLCDFARQLQEELGPTPQMQM